MAVEWGDAKPRTVSYSAPLHCPVVFSSAEGLGYSYEKSQPNLLSQNVGSRSHHSSSARRARGHAGKQAQCPTMTPTLQKQPGVLLRTPVLNKVALSRLWRRSSVCLCGISAAPVPVSTASFDVQGSGPPKRSSLPEQSVQLILVFIRHCHSIFGTRCGGLPNLPATCSLLRSISFLLLSAGPGQFSAPRPV